MSDAAAVQLAEALVADLNAHVFSQAFTAERAYLPCYKLEDMRTLHVTVVLAAFSGEAADRSRDREEHTLHVAVQKRVSMEGASVPKADVDALMAVCEEIRDYLRTLVLTDAPNFRRTKTECKPIYDPAHMGFGQFTSLLAFTYTVTR